MFLSKISDFLSFFSPKGKSKKFNLIYFFVTLFILLLSGISLGLMGLYFSAGSYRMDLFRFYLTQPLLVLFNTLPYLLICLLIWFLSDRAWIGFLTSGTLCLLYSFVNYWKLLARDDPLFAEDLTLFREALQMSGSYVSISFKIILAVLFVVLGTLFIALFARGKAPHFSLRILIPVLIIISFFPLYSNVYTSSSIYNSFPVWECLNPWLDNNRYISRGGIYPFINSFQSAFPSAPEGYSADDAEKTLASYENSSIPEDEKINIMCVMLEAFSDFSLYTDLITEKDPYELFHEIQDESYHGTLVTNIFAGGTIDTERCVLTGFSELSSFRRQSWSYARYFSENGYTVDGSHAGYKAFYNRYNVNYNLGFKNYKFIENHYNQLTDGIPTDSVLLPEICRLFDEEINQGNPVFSFNVTYQNHGPYATTLADNASEYIPRGDLSTEEHAIVNNYLTTIEDTCRNLYQTVEHYRNSDEPVILVFFGDHKPWLGDSAYVYSALGIDLFSETDEAFYNYYCTEYLIWANDAAKQVLKNDCVGEGPTISPCFLMNVLFDQCGWEGSSYTKFTNEVMASMPVVSTSGRILTEEGLIWEDHLNNEQKTLLSNMRKIQFYLSRDSQYRQQ